MNEIGENVTSPDQGMAHELRATLGLLREIGSQPRSMTQRNLAAQLGIALGLTNALIKRCVSKGLVKVASVPAKRYAYYLTPGGFAEKSRLTAEYISISLSFFRRAREEYDALFVLCRERDFKSVILYGAGDLTEIAVLTAQEHGIEITRIVAPWLNRESICGIPVHSGDSLPQADAVVLSEANCAQESYERLVRELPADRVLVPNLLNVIRRGDVP